MPKVALVLILLASLGGLAFFAASDESFFSSESEASLLQEEKKSHSRRSRVAEDQPSGAKLKGAPQAGSESISKIDKSTKFASGKEAGGTKEGAKAKVISPAQAAKAKAQEAKREKKAAAILAAKLAKETKIKASKAELARNTRRVSANDRVNLGIKGRVTRANFNRLSGYLYDTNDREAALEVVVLVDGEEKHKIPAGKREVNKSLGVIWHFDFKNPDSLKDRESHELRFYGQRVAGDGRKELASSPRRLQVNNYARGRLEACSAETGINGYAFDWDHSKDPIDVVFHLDGVKVKTVKANKKNALYKKKRYTPTDKNAFKTAWFVPSDSASHLIQAFALDPDTEELIELDGSPRSILGSSDKVNRPPEGRLDVVNKNVISGWAWDPDFQEQFIVVQIWMDGKHIITLDASQERQSLVSSKITKSPEHGFVVPTPTELLDGEAHQIRAFGVDRNTGIAVELERSRRMYRAGENDIPMGGFWRADEKMLRGWAADPDLGEGAAEIAIYIDGALWKTQKADRSETFIPQSGYAPNKEHGFLIVPPAAVQDGKAHQVEIFVHNYPEGPPKSLGKRTIGLKSIFPGFWTSDRELDSRSPQGLYITSVSPWYNAFHEGILKGDVLLTFGGVKYTKTALFRAELSKKYKKNEVVKMSFWRDGKTLEVNVKVGEIIGN